MTNQKTFTRILLTAIANAGLIGGAYASPLVYEPINPTFGGNPANGPVLMDQATAQNKHQDPSLASLTSSQSTLDQFNSQLQQAILSRVASSVTSSIVGTDGSLKPGTINTGNFSINIAQIANGNLQVTTTDKTSGASTTFVVSGGQ
ncbi:MULTISPECIES: curli assembly protein CsgF [unclassified Caballeronia]|jgi:curli production assembly/transport component CsgF|uniref:curli assembly protein CsgF n=1 Tax=unclassified Caballeronia TaxID=2646786 RepID=UPI001FD2D598|nr:MULTISPECIES: curli assembly protein CsgF [unclassified Caballeronia]MDR5774019.1 curli assembly protein CsgF [Caballeronia sp. LZ002]MDR5800119.1 curli assembly protein CsgF [Caballeronia sp. LZ001]MDR5849454.1 curli assembly protein CsgF [Caballeronia sp. LZ003]